MQKFVNYLSLKKKRNIFELTTNTDEGVLEYTTKLTPAFQRWKMTTRKHELTD